MPIFRALVIFLNRIRFMHSFFCENKGKKMNKLLLNEPPLIILPTLATILGLNEAIFLQQLYYWLEKSATYFDNRKWIYKSIKEWEQEFPFWSNSTIKRTISSLKKRKILLIKKIHPQIFYSINEENIRGQNELLEAQFDPKEVQSDLAKAQSDPRKVQNDPTKGQFDPSPIYNENQRDYTENTSRLLREYTLFVREWNEFASKNSLNKISSLTNSRKKKLQVRFKNGDFKKLFSNALVEIKKSQYLLGAKGWKISFDWLIQNDENILKVIEGNYRDKEDYAYSPLNNLAKNYVVEEW